MKNELGRLTSLGPKEPWQVGLLLPRKWDDMHNICQSFSSIDKYLGQYVVIAGQLVGHPIVNRHPVPYVSFVIRNHEGASLKATRFGHTKDMKAALYKHAQRLIVYGKVGMFRDAYQIESPEIIHPWWAGRVRPVYPGKPSVIGAEKVRERVLHHLRQSATALGAYLCELAFGSDEHKVLTFLKNMELSANSLGELVWQAHLPSTINYGERVHAAMDTINALALVRAAQANRKLEVKDAFCPQAQSHSKLEVGTIVPPQGGTWQERSSHLPFKLTDEQQQAVQDILDDMSWGYPMHRLLSGDVGTGKTAVYGTVAATTVKHGGRVAILIPNVALATQIHQNLMSFWPDMAIKLVIGDTHDDDLADAPWVIGTTALLHRDIGARGLVIVDEQQKFSRAQREQLLGKKGHLLEATATCTPRSQALLQWGIHKTTELHQAHVDRHRITRIWVGQERKALMQAVKETLQENGQVLIIYPLRENEANDDLSSQEKRRYASHACAMWDKLFPGKVRLMHGAQKDNEKTAAVEAMRRDEADVLIATTVVEVGIDLPRLRRVVIIEANRFGLTTLHQIRGRVARTGGTGYCDLYLYKPDDRAERLDVLCQTEDGFEIAREDMRLRGFGQLTKDSTEEKGFKDGILFKRPLSADAFERAFAFINRERAGE